MPLQLVFREGQLGHVTVVPMLHCEYCGARARAFAACVRLSHAGLRAHRLARARVDLRVVPASICAFHLCVSLSHLFVLHVDLMQRGMVQALGHASSVGVESVGDDIVGISTPVRGAPMLASLGRASSSRCTQLPPPALASYASHRR
eukprot:1597831-Pleurochrysis_carterae.AAC.2